jgi:hypothetical protein
MYIAVILKYFYQTHLYSTLLFLAYSLSASSNTSSLATLIQVTQEGSLVTGTPGSKTVEHDACPVLRHDQIGEACDTF